jgi:hypothetical protein
VLEDMLAMKVKLPMKRFLPLLAVVALAGCASMSSVKSSDMSGATSRTYAASQVATVAAVRSSIQDLGYSLKDTQQVNGVEQVYFSKPMSAFSWGEVARVDVSKVDAARSTVSVASEKRFQMQVTGMRQKDFAEAIFDKLDTKLAK